MQTELAFLCCHHHITRVVKAVRAILLICFSLGLFVQVSAQAAAMPQPMAQVAEDKGSSDVAPGRAEQMDADCSTPNGCAVCDEMALDCLIAMNCLSPLNLPATGLSTDEVPLARSPYPVIDTGWLKGQPIRPESPPPQVNLTV